MKTQIHKIATVTISLAMVTALSSCKDEEEKRREARQRELGLMAIPEFNQRAQQQQAQRARNEAVIDAAGKAAVVAGEVIGAVIQERNSQQNSSGGRQTQQQYDQSLQRQYYQSRLQQDNDETMRKVLDHRDR